jgi:hypothetical protein
MVDAVAGEGLADSASRKEPGLQAIEFPVASELGEQVGEEGHLAIALAFALAHQNDHALRVDIGALKPAVG